jgi:UDP-N-acetyl-D-glucosamine dehydrogenase
MKIAVIGLGYVGLPLSLQFARSCVSVIGLDVDAKKVQLLNNGQSYIRHIEPSAIAELVKSGKFSASTELSRIKEVEAVIICVPTPLTKNREPDISFVIKTGEMIAPYLAKGALVVLESTTYPGTTDEDLRVVLEVASGMKSRFGFPPRVFPEREDPANRESKVKSIKVVGGYTQACLRRAMSVYGQAIDELVPVSSCRVAEATKLLENIFQSVNTVSVNELKLVYAAMGIDIWEVVEAAKAKPFGSCSFIPALGLAAVASRSIHSISRGRLASTVYIRGSSNWPARSIRGMPEHVVHRVADALNAQGQSSQRQPRIVLGFVCKPNIDDERESPSSVLMDLPNERGRRTGILRFLRAGD